MSSIRYQDPHELHATRGAHELNQTFNLMHLLGEARIPASGAVEGQSSLTDAIRVISRATHEKLDSIHSQLKRQVIPSLENEALFERVIQSVIQDLSTSRSGAPSVEAIRAISALARDLEEHIGKKMQDSEGFAGLAHDLQDLSHDLSLLKVAVDHSKLQADGVHRGWTSVLSPRALQVLRERRGLDPIECEVVIIGAGPAGIAAAHHAQRLGLDAVLVEATYFAASMSDARALPVHLMRTNTGGSSLARHGLMPDSILEDLGMDQLMRRTDLRARAVAAREYLAAAEARMFPKALPSATTPHDTEAPVTRAEVYTYFMEVLDRALRSERLIATEQTPISEARWLPDEGRFLVRSSTGIELKPRYVVVSSGAVGAMVDNHRRIPILSQLAAGNPDRYIEVTDERTLLDEVVAGRQVIIPDAFIGLAGSRDYIRTLPQGTDALVIGSGESAAKGALALLELNPGIRVNLIVKNKLEPMQGQGPSFGGFKDAAVRGIEDPDFGKMTLAILRDDFGTPITPESMHDLLAAVSRGAVRIFEMGAYFDDTSVAAQPGKPGGRASTQFQILDQREDVRTHLQAQWREWRKAGLIRAEGECPLLDGSCVIDGPIVVAAGYNRNASLTNNPVITQLREQRQIVSESGGARGEIALDDETHLFSRANPQLAFSGAMMAHTSTDGVFSGSGIRSWLVVEEIARKLGHASDRTSQFAPTSPSGIEARPPDPKKAFVRANHEYRPHERFPGNPFLVEIARRQANNEKLSAAELLLLKRADDFFYRLRVVLRTNQVSPF